MPRKCRLCNHERRQEIERALLYGDSHRAIAQQFTVPRGAIARHLKHVSAALAHERELVESGKSVLVQLRELTRQAQVLKVRADRTGDHRTALGALRELTRLVELEARLTGAFNERSETKILNVTLDAEIARRMTETFLSRHQIGPGAP